MSTVPDIPPWRDPSEATHLDQPGRGLGRLTRPGWHPSRPVGLALAWVGLAFILPALSEIGLEIPASLRALFAFGAVLVCPGLLLGHLVLTAGETDAIDRWAIAYALSMGLMVPLGFVLMLVHSNIGTLQACYLILMMGLGAAALTRPQARGEPSRYPQGHNWPLLILAGLLLLAAAYLAAGGTLDGDRMTFAAFLRDSFDAPRLSVEEPLFGAGLAPSPRVAFNAWMLLPAFLARVSGIDPLQYMSLFLPTFLVIIAGLALYALMLELTGSRTFALFAVAFEFVYYLANPFDRAATPSIVIFRRIVSDKFMLLLLMQPVGLLFVARYLKSGRLRQWALTLLVGIAIAWVHPIGALFFATSAGAFALLHFLIERDRPARRRGLALLGALLITLIVPLILALMAFSGRADYLAPDLASLHLPMGPTLVLPWVWVKAAQMPGPVPLVPDSHSSGDVAFMMLRIWTQVNRQSLTIMPSGRYIADPALLIGIGTTLALALSVLLPFRFKTSLLARYLFAAMVAFIFLGFNPVLTPILGKAITPWQVYRMSWPLPVVPVLAFFAFGLLALPARRLGRFGYAMPALALCLAIAALWPHISSYTRSLIADAHSQSPIPWGLAEYLDAHPGANDEVVFGDANSNTLLAALVRKPDIVAQRATTTSEEFPADQQDVAKQRVTDVDTLTRAWVLDSSVLAALERYPTRWVVLRADHPLVGQLDHIPQTFTLRYQDPNYRLYERVGSLAELQASPLIRGMDALAAHDWQAAVTAFQAELGQNGHDVAAMVGLAQAYGELNRTEDQLAELAQADTQAHDPWTALALGQAQAAAARPDAAQQTFQAALARWPESKLLLQAAGNAHAYTGDLAAAARYYQAAVALEYPQGSSGYLDAVGLAADSRQLDQQASEAYARAAAVAPSLENWRAAGHAAERVGDKAAAERAYRAALRLAPWEPGLYSDLARLRWAAGDSAGAQKLHQQAMQVSLLAVQPAVPDLYLTMGRLYEQKGQLDNALPQFQQAIRLEPHDDLGYLELGQVFQQRFRFDDAEHAYRQAIAEMPQAPDPYVALARLLEERGRNSEAQALLSQATVAAPHSPVGWTGLGSYLVRQGQIVAGVDAFERGLELDPSNVAARVGLGDALRLNAQPERALGQYQVAAQRTPGSGRARTELGLEYRHEADLNAAMAEYARSIALAPHYGGAFIAQGEAYEALGQPDKALQSYRDGIAANQRADRLYLLLGRNFMRYERSAGLQMSDPGAPGAVPMVPNSAGSSAEALSAAEFQDALAQHLDYVPAYLALARLDTTMGYPDEAQHVLQTAASDTSAYPRVEVFLGDLYQQQGRPADAEKAYRAALAQDPLDGLAYIGLSQVAMDRGQSDQAVDLLRQAVTASPGLPDAYLALSQAVKKTGNPQGALAVLEQAVTRLPGSTDLRVGLASSYEEQSRFADAEQAYRQAIASQPGAYRPYLGLGALQQRQGQVAAAEASFSQASQVDRGQAEPWVALARLYRDQNRFQDAVTALVTATRVEPGSAAPLLTLGNLYHQDGQTGLAAPYLIGAAGLNRSSAEPHLALAQVKATTGDYSQALSELEAAAKAEPRNVTAQLALAAYYQQQGDTARGLAALQAAVAQNPGAGDAWAALTSALLANGRIADAVSNGTRGIAAAPADSRAFAAYGKALLAAGQADEAIAVLQRATQVAPGSADGWIALGDAYRGRDRRDEALAAYRAAMAADPRAGAPRVALGTALLDTGRQAEALSVLTEATQVAPAYAPAFLGLGKAYEAGGQLSQAEEAYRKAIDLGPIDPATYTGLGQLYIEQGLTAAAVDVYRRAVSLAPGLPAAQTALGGALTLVGDSQGGQDAFNQALQMRPGFVPARVAVATVLMKQGQLDAAATAIDQALRFQPGSVDALLVRGQIQQRETQWGAAAQTFAQAAGLDRSRAEAGLALGDLQMVRGDAQAALAAYQSAIAADPSNVDAPARLGQAYLKYGPIDKALSIFQQASQRYPWSAAAYVGLGDALRHQGQLDQALSTYQAGVAAAPRDPAAYLGLAAGLKASGEYTPTLALYRQVLAIAPIDAGAQIEISHLMLQAKDVGHAVDEAQQAAAAHPTDPQAFVALAEAYGANQDWQAAEQAVARALTLDPSAAQAWAARGHLAESRGDAAAGETALRTALTLAPGDAGIWSALGDLQLAHQRYADAAGSFRQAASAAPAQALGAIGQSKVAEAQARWDDGLALAEQAVATEPGAGAAQTARGTALVALGRLDEAAAAYRSSLRVEPGFGDGYLGLGNVLVDQAQFAAAIHAYRDETRLATAGVGGYLRLGDLYLRIGPTDEARTAFASAIQRDARSAPAWVGMGNLYRHTGQPQQAASAYRSAIQADPSAAAGYVALAGGQVDAADFAAARASYLDALGRAADDLGALQGLATLDERLGDSASARALAQGAVTSHPYSPQAATMLGDLLLDQRNYQAAAGAYQAALKLQPRAVEALVGMARLQNRQQQDAQARQTMQGALTVAPNDATVWTAWGDMAAGQKDWQSAGAAYARAVVLAANQAAGYVGLGQVAEQRDNLGEARAQLRAAVGAEPGAPAAHVGLAGTMLASDPTTAQKEFLEATRVEPATAATYLAMGDFLVARQDIHGAVASYQRYNALTPASTTGYLRIAEAYRESGQVDASAAALQQLAGLKIAQTSTTYMAIGRTYDRLLRSADAMNAFQAALRLDPGDSNARLALVRALVATQQLAWAAGLARAGVAAQPHDGASLTALGIVQAAQSDPLGARKTYEQALRDDPGYAGTYFELGDLLDRPLNQLQDAVDVYERGLALDPANVQGYRGLANIWKHHGELAQATDYYTAASSASPGKVLPRLALAQTLIDRSQLEPALAVYNQTLGAASDNAGVYCARAGLEQHLWHYDQALGSLDLCLALSKSLVDSQDGRQAFAAIQANVTDVTISSPAAGATVKGAVTVRGTATDVAFQYYKLEFRPAGATGDGGWQLIGDLVAGPVQSGVLGVWNTSALAPGQYVLRLTVVDNTGNYPQPGEITVTVQR